MAVKTGGDDDVAQSRLEGMMLHSQDWRDEVALSRLEGMMLHGQDRRGW